MSDSTHTNNVLAVVTGSSGFVGSAIALRFLHLGHSVRLPLRTPQQADAWLKQYGDKYKGKIDPVVLEGAMSEKGVFDRILEGADVVVHAASPAKFDIETDAETDILKPALAGTLSLLESAKKTSSVKSVVITSSLAAYGKITDIDAMKEDVYWAEDQWNPTTYEEAAKMSNDKGPDVYAASKGISEKAAWEFVKQPDVHFKLATCAPVYVLGHLPVAGVETLANVKDAYSSFGFVFKFLWDKTEYPPHDGVAFHPKLFVSPNDVARAHVAAALDPATSGGRRYLLSANYASWEQLAAAIIKAEPELKKHLPPLPEKLEEVKVDERRNGGDRVEKAFKFEYEPFDKYIGAFAKQAVELAKASGQL